MLDGGNSYGSEKSLIGSAAISRLALFWVLGFIFILFGVCEVVLTNLFKSELSQLGNWIPQNLNIPLHPSLISRAIGRLKTAGQRSRAGTAWLCTRGHVTLAWCHLRYNFFASSACASHMLEASGPTKCKWQCPRSRHSGHLRFWVVGFPKSDGPYQSEVFKQFKTIKKEISETNFLTMWHNLDSWITKKMSSNVHISKKKCLRSYKNKNVKN